VITHFPAVLFGEGSASDGAKTPPIPTIAIGSLIFIVGLRFFCLKNCYPTAEHIFQIEQAGCPRQPDTESAENDPFAPSNNFITQNFTNGYGDGSGTEIAIFFDDFVRSLA
jgi:hypothetical protein